MITNKWMDRTILAAMLLAILALGIFASFSGRFSPGVSLTYQQGLFSSGQVMTVDIQIDPDQWQQLLDTAISEEYFCCDITVNGENYYRVGIRAKGNTSLSMVAASDSDRYSFKIKFDEYVEGQTCQGLDKLVLNNNYADATLMKEAVVYDMFSFLEVPASLFSYAKISVNGEYWGLYLALEAVEESFALRNYGTHYGKLYKPDSMEMDGPGRMEQVDPDRLEEWFAADPNTEESGSGLEGIPPAEGGSHSNGQFPGPEGEQKRPGQGEGPNDFSPGENPFGGMGGSSGSAAALNYVGDDLDDYSVIWDSEVFSSKKSDHKRVVQSLKNISEGINLEESMDVDRVLRYLAVQTFVVNLDGLSGNMAHNYYLYEKDGQLSLVPWDYNLAFGGFQSGDASAVINFPIDTPFSSGVSAEDRQFFMALLNREEYREQYYVYLEKLAQEYVNGGRFDALYESIRSQIDTLAAQDPTAFYSYEAYDPAAQMLYQTVQLRAESVLGQLAGSIPATHEAQNQQSSLLLDASPIDLTVMGSMMGGGHGREQGAGGRGNPAGFSDGQQADPSAGNAALPEQVNPGEALPSQPFGPPENASGSGAVQQIQPDEASDGNFESTEPPGRGMDTAIEPAPEGEGRRPKPEEGGEPPSEEDGQQRAPLGEAALSLPEQNGGEQVQPDGQDPASNPAGFDETNQRQQTPSSGEREFFKGGSPFSAPEEQNSSDGMKNLPVLGGLLLVLALAVLGAEKYRRR